MKKNLLFVAAASIALASCSNEEVVELNNGNAIDFRVAMGSEASSRGQETNTNNLQGFNVTAFNTDADVNYFTNVLFSKQASDGTFRSENTYLWPGSDLLHFYAYAPATDAVKDLVSINNTAQTITDFVPAAEVKDQIDLITAYVQSSKTTSSVALTFNHALTQVQIKALSNSEVYKFEVKGAQIATVNSKGTLNMNGGNTVWSFDATPEKASYTVTYDNAIELGATAHNISVTTESGLPMILPQQLTKWDNKNDANNANKGAFLAVLLKITTKETGMQVYPKPGKGVDGSEFAWACLPIDTEWEAGYLYTYNLDFSKGAGQVPPTDPDEPGEDILGGPIYFSATVSEWKTAADINNDMSSDDNK